ncbi:MAG: hypothetical protein IVW54_16650 [Candidatus Binataceae bacterium]|nr:hypothetical protein [Candidatus Binataceae bacterium]
MNEREHFVSTASDFLEFRVQSLSGGQAEVHASIAAGGTRLHLTSSEPFQVSVQRRNRTKPSIYLSHERSKRDR